VSKIVINLYIIFIFLVILVIFVIIIINSNNIYNNKPDIYEEPIRIPILYIKEGDFISD
jgi:uncharacterized alpha/beta hydrolase family protein